MSRADFKVKHVDGSHYDVMSIRGPGVRIIENGPIHPLVDGQPTSTRLTLFEAKQYLGLRESALQ